MSTSSLSKTLNSTAAVSMLLAGVAAQAASTASDRAIEQLLVTGRKAIPR